MSSKEKIVQGGRRWTALAKVGCGSKDIVRMQPGIGTREELSACNVKSTEHKLR